MQSAYYTYRDKLIVNLYHQILLSFNMKKIKQYFIITILWIVLYFSFFEFSTLALDFILPEPPEYIAGDFDTSIYLPHIHMLFTIKGISFLIFSASSVLYLILKKYSKPLTFKFMIIASLVFYVSALLSSFAFYIVYDLILRIFN